MELIDYNKLIDPFCISVIKYMREELGIDTDFCCQGETSEDSKDEHHSLRGYVSAVKCEESIQTFLKIYELLESRWPMLSSPASRPKFVINSRRNAVTFYFPIRKWKTKEELKNEWNLILEAIKK